MNTGITFYLITTPPVTVGYLKVSNGLSDCSLLHTGKGGPTSRTAVCDVLLADALHNKPAHLFTLLSDTSEHIVGFTEQWQTVYLDSLRTYFHLCVLPLSLSVLYLPISPLFLARPQSVWHSHCCKVPLTTSIAITGSDFLHRGSASPEGPLEFHAEIRCDTHSLRKVLLGMEQMPDISFIFFFIHLYLPIYPLALFVSWVDFTMNNLLLLKETTWGR